MSSILMGLGIT